MVFVTKQLPFDAPKMGKSTKCPFRKGDVVFFGDTGPCVVKKVVGPIGPPSNLPFWSFQIEVMRPGRAMMTIDDMVPTANPDLMMPHPSACQSTALRPLRRISLVEYRERYLPFIGCECCLAAGTTRKKGEEHV